MSNVLDLFDQTIVRFEQATGVTSVGQCAWVYSHDIDIDGLRRFHHHLQRGRLSRRIERSPLPFGRARWVSPSRESELQIVATPRPREEFDAWLSEQAATPLDAEHGPGWRLAVLPFTDGGAGVSLVVLHSLVDGMAGCLAVAEAASGYDSGIDWPAAGSRRRWQALREDARQTARDIPGIGRALVAAAAAARLARSDRGSDAAAAGAPPTSSDHEAITIPTATIFIDADDWDARAAVLGGTGNTLLAGLAARLAERMGRVAPDGAVTLAIPVSDRTADDTRANAVTNVDVTVTPTTTDLRRIRAATKQALIHRQEVSDERWALLPLVPLLPKRLARRCVGVAAGCATGVVSSNLGTTPPAINRPDGTDADFMWIRSVYPDMTKATMERTGGVLALLSARVNRQVFISVQAYQPGMGITNDVLQQSLSCTLGEFSLNATTGQPATQLING